MMFSVFLICMGFVFVKGNTDNTTDFALRLINPLANKSKEGRLEIYYNGSWGTVCDDFFTDVSARVACASLGFGDMGAVTVNRYGPGTDSIWMDDVKCNGTENGIEQCSHHPWGTHDCTHREDVSINCGNATKAMRLNNSLGVNLKEGRLEIYYNGSWGTVCDDKFTTASARVACASLGFGYMGVVIGNRYGAGTGRIWLDDVNCTGTESFLERCTHNWWGVHNCHHDEDVSISCGNTRDFAIRLYNFFGNNSKEGRLEIYYSGKWGTVCDDFFTDVNAGVACASLGFGYIGAVIGNHYGPGTNQIWLDDVICVGTESGIDRCTHRGWGMHNCGHGEDVSISCGNTRVFAVRLSNSIGSNSKEGRLEIYYSGKWGTVCDDYFTNVNARVACVSLGFGDMGVVIGNRYGAGTGDIWLDDVNCTGTETGIQQCTHRPWGQHNCQHSEDVSVGCDCGDRNFTGRSGKISSPNFPLGYANGLDCNNYITATSVETIIITFLTFNTEPSSDWVTVTCDSGSTYTTPSYSGFELPPVLIIPACHSVKVYFHSDSSTTYTGFSLTYSMSTVCGERYYSGLSGKVSSPNYPMRYTNNLECYNYITVSHGQTVIVTFLNFNTESGFDWVQISCVSGNTITSPLYSGSQIPSVLTISSCRIVNVHFHTNNNVTDTGFSLTYNITVISGQNGSNTTAGSMVTVPTSRVPITTILTNANNATEPTTITVVPTTTGTATVQTTTSEAVVTTQVVTTPNSIGT